MPRRALRRMRIASTDTVAPVWLVCDGNSRPKARICWDESLAAKTIRATATAEAGWSHLEDLQYLQQLQEGTKPCSVVLQPADIRWLYFAHCLALELACAAVSRHRVFPQIVAARTHQGASHSCAPPAMPHQSEHGTSHAGWTASATNQQ